MPDVVSLTPADWSAVLDCVHTVNAAAGDDPAGLAMAMLRAIAGLVPATLSAFTVVDPVLGESSGHLHPAGGDWPVERIAPLFQQHIADHPVVAYSQRTRDGQAKSISDFLTPRQFHATGIYRALFGPMGIEDQLSIGMVGTAGLMVGLSFNRARRGFSPRDRAVLNALRPHLMQAYLAARERQVLRNADGIRRGTVVDRLPVGLVCVDRKGGVVWSTEPVRSMWVAHFPDAADSIHGLPHAVRLWLRSKAAEPLVSRRPGVALHVRRCPLKNGHAVLLVQEHPTPTVTTPSVAGRGFTERESQVMARILAGSTPTAAAVELKISPRTVQKHLERVFQKLGVNSLSAACVRLMGTG